MCGSTKDYYGNEQSLIDAFEIQHLKKYREGAEAIILKNGLYPFVSLIPDYAYIDIFGEYPLAELEVKEHDFNSANLTFRQWYLGLGTTFRYPFKAGE